MRFSLHDSTLSLQIFNNLHCLHVCKKGPIDSSTSQKTKGPKLYLAPSPSVLNLESNPYD